LSRPVHSRDCPEKLLRTARDHWSILSLCGPQHISDPSDRASSIENRGRRSTDRLAKSYHTGANTRVKPTAGPQSNRPCPIAASCCDPIARIRRRTLPVLRAQSHTTPPDFLLAARDPSSHYLVDRPKRRKSQRLSLRTPVNTCRTRAKRPTLLAQHLLHGSSRRNIGRSSSLPYSLTDAWRSSNSARTRMRADDGALASDPGRLGIKRRGPPLHPRFGSVFMIS